MIKKENVLKFMQYIEKLAKVYEFNIPYGSYDIYAFAKDLLVWLEKQRDKDKLIQELGEYKVKYTQEVLEKYINSMSNKDDERLRKTAIAFLKDFAEKGYENAVECIDWLEKQGEQTSSQTNERAWLYLVSDVLTWKDGIGQYLDDPRVQELAKKLCSEYSQKLYNPSNTGKNEQKYADKIKPEFKVGDWITFYGGNPYKILKIEEEKNGVLDYLLLDQNGHDFYFSKAHVDKNVRLWTIENAKDGDVLIDKSHIGECVFIFKEARASDIKTDVNNPLAIIGYCGINHIGFTSQLSGLGFGDTVNCTYYPATKEQRDTLMKAMNDAGYEWDADKKELKKLVLNKFDPKTLKPFDKVLVKQCDIWHPDFYSCYIEDDDSHVCSGLKDCYFCIPYNDDTKHLAGTKDEAPDYYRYWED